MWLLAAAPTVSRVLPALAASDTSAWNSVGDVQMAMGDMSGMPGMSHMPGMPGMPESPGDPVQQHLDHCGYCVLLAHTPLLSGAILALLLAAPLPAVPPVVPANVAWHAQPLLSANPRGPPSILPG